MTTLVDKSIMTGRQPFMQPERLFFYAALLLSVLSWMAALPHWEQFARRQFVHQDMLVMVVMIVAMLVLPRLGPTSRSFTTPRLAEPWWVVLACVSVIVIAFAVRTYILQSYLLARDEEMVLQDAIIFASGHRFMPIQPDWKALQLALNTDFFNPAMVGKGWLSDYKPVNALIHAGFLKFAAFAWAAPIMAAASVVLLWRIALRIWPDRPDVRLVAGVLLLTSAQFVVTAATPFSMTAHLMLNLLWLLFFMKDRLIFHVCAIAVGFLATGLHQVPYHPAFALPFCVLLLWQRRFALSAAYAVSYAAILHFWMQYPFLPVEAAGPSSVGRLGMIAHDLIGYFSKANVSIMAADLVRLLAWNHILMLPLILIAIADPRVRRNPLMVAIIASLALTILMKFVFRPAQGHGWGFRYMHGLIGIACLLAAEGWRRWYDAEPVARTTLLVSTGGDGAACLALARAQLVLVQRTLCST